MLCCCLRLSFSLKPCLACGAHDLDSKRQKGCVWDRPSITLQRSARRSVQRPGPANGLACNDATLARRRARERDETDDETDDGTDDEPDKEENSFAAALDRDDGVSRGEGSAQGPAQAAAAFVASASKRLDKVACTCSFNVNAAQLLAPLLALLGSRSHRPGLHQIDSNNQLARPTRVVRASPSRVGVASF